jgi:hypothetical protein
MSSSCHRVGIKQHKILDNVSTLCHRIFAKKSSLRDRHRSGETRMKSRAVKTESSMNGSVVKWTCRSKRGVLYIVALLPCLLAASANSAGLPANPLLFSSATSPDGVWIAENFGTEGCCGGGFVLVHKISEASAPSDAAIFSPSPASDLFLIWRDDSTLSLVQDSNSEPLKGPSTYRGIAILYLKYQNKVNYDHFFGPANVSQKVVQLKNGNISADTSVDTTKSGRLCRLSLTAIDGTIYDKVGLHIVTSVNHCNRSIDCAGISSEFWIGKRIDGQQGIALTSATVSDIPSYNRLPTGDHNSAVRGSFGEGSAVDLVTALSSEMLDVQYSLNFFDAIISYRLETSQIASSIDSFKTCISGGDFNWIIREKTKPSSPAHPNK